MAASRAVIASDIPGIREALAPAGAGILVPPADAAALASAIEALVDDERRRAELGRRARGGAAERYSPATKLDRTLTLLDPAGPSPRFSSVRPKKRTPPLTHERPLSTP